MDGFEHAKQPVTLKEGAENRVKLDLKKGSVVVEIKVAPENASLAIDGKPVTGAKMTGLTSSVSHTLTVSSPGYTDQQLTFSGAPMETKTLEVMLDKAPEKHVTTGKPVTAGSALSVVPPPPVGNGKLNVGASGGWCNVTVDGAPRGATPVAGLELSAGSHKVTCTSSDGKVQQAIVAVPADGTARYKFAL